MSANISTNNSTKQAEVFTAGLPAWHHLGVNVQEAQTWEQAIKLAHLDWTISKHQLLNPVTSALIPSYAILRDDNNSYLSTVGEKYTPVQNKSCFDFVDALLESKDAHFETAGALGNGERVWCLARLNKTFAPIKGDEHKTYLLFTDSRDGKAAQCKLTTVRVVCNNTLTQALAQDTDSKILRLRHTSGIEDKINTAKTLIKCVSSQINSLSDKLAHLASVKVTQRSLADVLGKLFPEIDKSTRQRNMAAQIAENFMSNDNNAIPAAQGTMYSLLNSVTQWTDHQRDGFRTGDGGMSALPAKRAEAALFGSGDTFKSDALDSILAIVDSTSPKTEKSKVDSILSMVNSL